MTPILANILPLVAEHARSQASAFLEGQPSIGGTVDQEIWEFLARHDVLWDSLSVAEQDQIRDGYLESFKQTCAQRIAPSDYAGKHGPGTAAQRMGMGAISSPPTASGVIPTPSVPEAVKEAEKALELNLAMMRNLRGDCLRGKLLDHGRIGEGLKVHIESAESALSALRRLTVEDEGDSLEGLRVPASGLDSSGADASRVGAECAEVLRGLTETLASNHIQVPGSVISWIGKSWKTLSRWDKVQTAMVDASTGGASATQGDHPAGRESKALASKNETERKCSECGSSLPFLKVEGGTKCQGCGAVWLWPDFGSSEDKELLKKPDPGEGWRLLEVGETLQDGDGFLHPDNRYGHWISYDCRPDMFRGQGKEFAHAWPWRRKVEASTTSQKGGHGV